MSTPETTHATPKNGTAPGSAYAKTKELPPIDVYENKDEILIVADVPGANSERLTVQVDGKALRFEAKVDEQRSFVRSLAIPDGIDEGAISAETKDGLLVIRMPKLAERKTRQIPVKSG